MRHKVINEVNQMREPDMFEPMLSYLQQDGYTVSSINKGQQRGPDIIAEKGGDKLVIELKGDTKALKTDWCTGLGQLLSNMKEPRITYAMAVSQRYKKLVDSFPSYPKDNLGLLFFVVDDSGKVNRL
jgi:hypothetical protein